LTNEQAIATIIGFFVPFIVSWIKKEAWSFERKVLVVWIISFIFAFLNTLFTNQLSLSIDKIIIDLAIIIGVSQTFYSMLYEKIFEKKEGGE
jgi:hypothetical protein